MPVTGLMGSIDATPGNFSLGVTKLDAYLNIAQSVVEVLFIGIPPVRISQSVLEVLYKPDPFPDFAKSVKSSIAVAQNFTGETLKGVGRPALAESAATVSQNIIFTVQASLRKLSTFISVAQTIYAVTDKISKSLLNNVQVAQAIIAYNTGKFQSVKTDILVGTSALTTYKDADAESLISVSQSISGRNSTIKANTSSLVHANQIIGVRTNVTNMLITSIIVVTQTPFGSKDINRFSVRNDISIGHAIDIRNTNIRKDVTNYVFVADTIVPDNTVKRIEVVSNISISQGQRLNFFNLFVNTYVGVASKITARNSVVRIGVVTNCGVDAPSDQHNSSVKSNCGDSIVIDSNCQDSSYPPRMRLTDIVTVAATTFGRNSSIRMRVISNIGLNLADKHQSPNENCTTACQVGHSVQFQSDNPRLPIVSLVKTKQFIDATNSNPRIEIIHRIRYVDNFFDLPVKFWTGATSTEVEQVVHVNSIIGIGVGPNNKQKVITRILVKQNIYNTFIAQTVVTRLGVKQIIDYNGYFDASVKPYIIKVKQAIGVQTDNNRQSVKHLINVQTEAQGPIILAVAYGLISVRQTIGRRVVAFQRVRAGVPVRSVGPLLVTQTIDFGINPDRQTIISSINVNQRIDSHNTNTRLSVAQLVKVVQKFKLAEITVHQFVQADSKINRASVYTILHQFLPAQTLQVIKETSHSIFSLVKVNSAVDSSGDFTRTFEDILIFPGGYRERIIDGEPIMVPIVTGVKVDKYVTITARSQTILLPPPDFDDSEAIVGSVDIKRSITGLSYVHVQTTDRRKINWPFKLALDKAVELRSFMITNISEKITITDWKGQRWLGYFTCNPIQFTSESRYSGKREKINVEIEFEAVKL